MRDLRIVFMGTPEFAVPALELLIQQQFNVVGVVTATDKPGGRGRKEMISSAVKACALAHQIPVLQPVSLKSPAFLEALRSLHANLQIVVAFRMLPEIVWDMPAYGTFNLHGSLLPKYRGAAPINWAIIRGEKETGVTTFFLDHAIDTGNIILQEKLPIGENETAGELHDRMAALGATLVLHTVEAIAAETIIPAPQNDAAASHAPKIFKETCQISFNQSTEQVHNFVRGLSPYPGAWFMYNNQEIKILKTSKDYSIPPQIPGTVLSDHKTFAKITTLDGAVMLEELQLQGRRRMRIRDFLNGFKFN